MEPFTGPHSVTRKEACKSAQKGAACLAFSHIARATFLSRIHSLPNAYPGHTCAPHSSRPKFIASSSPLSLLPVRPFHHDRRVSSLARTARVLSAFQPALHQFKVRALDPSPCFPSSFVLLSLSFPLPRVCLLRSLVGIIPRQGNYRYPELHNATLTHVYNRRHTPANISRYWYAWRQLTMKILTPDMNTLPRLLQRANKICLNRKCSYLHLLSCNMISA